MNQTPAKPKNKKAVRDTRAEALKIANSIKIDGQTKADTTAIANGIQRGIEQFLRQQSEKTRDLDKRAKKVKQLSTQISQIQAAPTSSPLINPKPSRLPWLLLSTSWIFFFVVTGYFWKVITAQ